VGAVLGCYGLAISVVSTLVSRGRKVDFPKNPVINVRFGARATAPNQFLEAAGN
jgi:hypothetical protein